MAFQYKPATLKKLEAWFKEAGYLIRYERGNFNSGYCILEQKRVVVINKFFDLEARLNALVDIQTEVVPALRESHPELAEDGAEWVEARAAIRPEFQQSAEAVAEGSAKPSGVQAVGAEEPEAPGQESEETAEETAEEAVHQQATT